MIDGPEYGTLPRMKSMKASRSCPKCEATLEHDAQVCESCDQEFCPDCLTPIDSDAVMCHACGAEFDVVCPSCDAQIDPAAERCPACGYLFSESTSAEVISGRAMTTQATLTEAGMRGELNLEEQTDAVCPSCGVGVIKLDGYCNSCGTPYCPTCALAVDDDDEVCPHCGVAIFFDCPQCGFELTTGTDLCPECHALFYMICPSCNQEVDPLAEICANCHQSLEIRQRETARVIHTVVVADRLVRGFACTSCGEQFDSRTGICPNCSLKVCVNCQLVLEEEEDFCPRCRPDLIGSTLPAADQIEEDSSPQTRCPTCGQPVERESDACAYCGQLLCPNCAAAVGEDDFECGNCGATFELACPACDTVVTVEDTVCPSCGLTL